MKKTGDRSVFFFLTELFFSAKIVARSVLFPFIVEAAEIFVKFEEKVFNKLKERFIKKTKLDGRNFETACRKVLMFF